MSDLLYVNHPNIQPPFFGRIVGSAQSQSDLTWKYDIQEESTSKVWANLSSKFIMNADDPRVPQTKEPIR